MSAQPRVALVTDWMTIMGGGEKVVEQFHTLYPDAPIYTSYCSEHWREDLDGKVITGYLQHWPFSKLRRFLPVLRQWWFARLDLSNFDIIISITGNGEAKFVRPDYISLKKRLSRILRPSSNSPLPIAKPLHICYCHTPPHFYWAQYDEYLKRPSMRPYWLARLGLKLLVKPLRKRDYSAAQNVDYFIANSTNIQKDIKRFYNRESEVIFPPINCEQFIHISPRGKKRIPEQPQCIWWGRVVPAKRLDIAIEACNQLAIPFTIVGKGPELENLRKLAGPTITLTGYLPDEERDALIKDADLFLFPSFEDFGVAPVEALAAGLPVIAYGAGGALDYINEEKNGLLFESQTSQAIASKLSDTIGMTFENNPETTARFDVAQFHSSVRDFVTKVTKDK